MNARLSFILIASLLAGCSSGEADTNDGLSANSEPPLESKIERVEHVDGKPSMVITSDGQRVAFESGEATVGDTMALAMPGGEVEYHRRPIAIMAELARAKVAYLVEGTNDLVYFEGLEGNPRVDSESGQLCWMAVSCKNSGCSAEAPFSFEKEGYSIDATGQVVRPDASTAQGPATTPPCPHCDSRDFLKPYRPAEVVEFRQRLEAELDAVRAARTRVVKP